MLAMNLYNANDFFQYVEWRDRSDMNMQLPVVEVPVSKQVIWPVISIAQVQVEKEFIYNIRKLL